MKTMMLGKTGLTVPVIAVGCMRIGGMEQKERAAYLAACLENGLNFFDHADIYGKGRVNSFFRRHKRKLAQSAKI